MILYNDKVVANLVAANLSVIGIYITVIYAIGTALRSMFN